jgi:hypothetical protein
MIIACEITRPDHDIGVFRQTSSFPHDSSNIILSPRAKTIDLGSRIERYYGVVN